MTGSQWLHGQVRCLSIRQPHAFLICAGIKPVENRTWSTNYRGQLLIHAGKARETANDRSFAIRTLRDRYGIETAAARRVYEPWAARGAIVGTAELYDCVRPGPGPIESTGSGQSNSGSNFSEWFSGPVGFLLKDTGFFATPMPSRGRLSLYRPDREALLAVLNTEVLSAEEWRKRELGNARTRSFR